MECEFRIKDDEGTKGYILIMAMVFTTIMLIMGLAIIYLGQVECSLTKRTIRSGQALQLAEAGIERTIWELRGHPDWAAPPPPTNLYTDESLGAGTYSVVLSQRSRHRVTVTSTGRVRGKERAVQVEVIDRGQVVGFWKFDEGDGNVAHDSTRNKNRGVIINGADWITDGRFGYALSFDGEGQYVRIPSAPILNLAHEITLDHWFRTTSPQSGSEKQYMVMKGDYRYGTSLTASRTLSFYVRLRNVGVKAVSYTNPGGFGDGNWHRVTGTFDGRYLRLYHNRILRGTTDIGTTDTITFDDNPLRFAHGGSNFFRGALDEIKITDRALLPEDF